MNQQMRSIGFAFVLNFFMAFANEYEDFGIDGNYVVPNGLTRRIPNEALAQGAFANQRQHSNFGEGVGTAPPLVTFDRLQH